MNKTLLSFSVLIAILLLVCSCDRHEKLENPAVVMRNVVTDIDGNSYDGALIGGRLWMTSNLKTSRYSDGTPIPNGGKNYSDSLAYSYTPGNEEDNVKKYGRLYNWSAVVREMIPSTEYSVIQGVCPDGWHVPSYGEWKALADTVKLNKQYTAYSGSVAKALAATADWDSSIVRLSPGREMTKNNATGFSALPSGCFNFGNFVDLGAYAYFWTSTRTSAQSNYAVSWSVGFDRVNAISGESSLYYGMAVRCVQD